MWNGGSRHNHRFYLTSSEEAGKYLESNQYDYVEPVELEVFDTLEEWYDWKDGKIKERALSKLTAEERRALGFS